MADYVFFDIGGTLGAPKLSPPPIRLTRLVVYGYTSSVLSALRNKGVQLGIISNTGNENFDDLVKILQQAGIYEFFTRKLLFFSSVSGLEKNSPENFRAIAEKVIQFDPSAQCLFVGEDSRERMFALNAGWRVCPHPLLVQGVLEGDSLEYARIVAPAESPLPWREKLRAQPLVPIHVAGPQGKTFYAIMPRRKIAALANLLFDVQLLGEPNDPLTTDLFLLRDDLATETGYLTDEGQAASFLASDESSRWLKGTTAEGLLVALPGDQSVENFHFEHARHGHNLKLAPDTSLLQPFGDEVDARNSSWLLSAPQESKLSHSELQKLLEIDSELINGVVDRYAGVTDLGDDKEQPILTRHIHSPDNLRAVAQLAADLNDIGGENLSVTLNSFNHEGEQLLNVVAELTGETTNEIVLVTAHLDSTAANSRPYEPSNHPAPGADDDASGMAGVLAAARVILALASENLPKRSIRFILFNAEEHGLIGSSAYARDAAAADEGIVALFQMDMIGYNKNLPRTFEVHTGCKTSPEVEARSRILAERIREVTELVSPSLSIPQIYPGPDGVDPADGRSDHAPFQRRGYAACVTSEDFFVGPNPDSPSPEDNPDYHKKTDTFVDPEYAADIARVVAAAAWVSARN
ncbi:M20/M25/M40 family metallo-hydrolase [Roseibium album]|uniref:M20/M25/M40 family metallo-hydrolase n=1 Tax=Roseibium album TaxID=311410 RepID=UPI003296BB51